VAGRAPSNNNRRPPAPAPAGAPAADGLWARWTRIAPGIVPIIALVAAVATFTVAFSAYYSGVVKAQERAVRERLCNLVGYRNSAHSVERYVVATLSDKERGSPEALTAAVFKADGSALSSIPLKDVPPGVVGYFIELIFDSELTQSYAFKINKEDPKNPATMLSPADAKMLKAAEERLEKSMNAIDDELKRYGVTFETATGGAKLARAPGCQPSYDFSPP
jgi:hypothetical protein